MRYFCILLLILLASPNTLAQPVFPSWSEYRLSEAPCASGLPPALALLRDGSGFVFWDSASQQIGSDGHPAGGNSSSFGFAGAAIALEDGSYALLSSSRIQFSGYHMYRFEFRLRHLNEAAAQDSSPVLYSAFHSDYFPESHDGQHEYSAHAGLFASPFGVHLSWNVLGIHISDYSGYSGQCRLGMDRWNPYANSYAWIIDKQPYASPPLPFGMEKPLPMAFHRISDAWNGRRYRFLRRPIDPRGTDDSTFVRLINQLSPGGALISEAVIDSVPARGTDLSTLPIASASGVDLLQRHVNGGVLVERLADDGTIVDSLLLPIDVRVYNGMGRFEESDQSRFDSSHAMLDMAGQRLPDGRILLAWSALGRDDSADVYVGLCGSDWTLLGPPKRLNSVTARHQYGVRLCLHGDSVSVAWLDNRDSDWHVYYRCFAIDHVLSASPGLRTPSFEITGPWPHPASGRTTFSIDGSAENISLRIVDALGRISWTGSTAGSSRFSIDMDSFLPGLYFLHALTKNLQSVRVFIVQ